MIRTIHRAKYVVAEADLVLQNAAVHVSDPGRISRVVPWTGPSPSLAAEVIDWGEAVLLPGLVNAHTHLELTPLAGRLREFTSFADWVRRLVEARRTWSRKDFLAAVRDGAQMALRGGTTLVGDISSSGFSAEALQKEKLRKVVYEEILSFLPEKVGEAVSALETRIGRIKADALLQPGVSPHAPYSVSPGLYRAAWELARAGALPFATHTAETPAELELLESGSGELRRMLADFGALPEGWRPPGARPVPYLASLGVLERPAALIHCNYVDEDSLALILQSRCSVVYCPRSHAFFGHPEHPVRRMLDLGINVALGTDSLASNDTLSMLDEVRYLFSVRKDLRPEEILRMATLHGAAALGFAGVTGRLRRGYWADMTVLALADTPEPRRLVARILEGDGDCIATIVQGELAFRLE